MAIFPLRRVNNEDLLGELETAVGFAEDDLGVILGRLLGLSFVKTTFGILRPFDVVTQGDVRWESLYDLNMDASHVRGRNWSEEDAVRDILQNALDANDEAGKPFELGKNVVPLGVRTLVIDNGPGMPVNTFAFGGTKVGPCLRGGFGEGLKLAVGTLILREREPVVFITRDGTVMVADFFTATGNIGRGIVIASNDRWLGVVIGKLRKPVLRKMLRRMEFGTIAVLPVSSQVVTKLIPGGKVIFSTKMPPTLQGNDCLKDYRIIAEEPTNIYVGGLLFHPSELDAMLLYKKSVYSYDLWANPYTGEIESSRNNYTLSGAEKMAVKLYRLWNEFFKREPERATKAFTEVVKRGLKTINTQHGPLFIINRDEGPGELSVSPTLLSEEEKRLASELMTRAIERALGMPRGQLALLSISPNETNRVGEVIYRTGKLPLIYHANWPAPNIEDMTTALFQEAVKLKSEMGGLKEYDGTLAHEIMKVMAERICAHANWARTPEVHVGHCIAPGKTTVCGTSIVDRENRKAEITVAVLTLNGKPRTTECIIETLLHEMAHALPFLKHGIPETVSDVSADFERALGAMATLMTLHGKKILNRALVFGAQPTFLPPEIRDALSQHVDVYPEIPAKEYPLVVGFRKNAVTSMKPFMVYTPAGPLTPEKLGEMMPVLTATKADGDTILRILEVSAGLNVADATVDKVKATALKYGDSRIHATMVRNEGGATVTVWVNGRKTIELTGKLKEIKDRLMDMLVEAYHGVNIPKKPKPEKKKAKISLLDWLGR